MRILHIVTRGSGGGTSRSIDHMLQFERSLGHEVYLITGSLVIEDRYQMTSRFLKREIHPLFDLLAWYDLHRRIKSINPDLIHTHESKAGILGRLNSKRKGQVIAHTVHMATFSKNWFQISLIANVSQILEYWASKRTDYLYFVGKELADIYEKKRIKGRISSSVARSFLSVESFGKVPNRKYDQAEIFTELGLPDGARIVLTVGLLEKRKNHSFIINSLAKMLLTNSDVYLLIAGSGRFQNNLEELCLKLQVSHKVHFLGFRNDIARLMNSADVLVHASKIEGVPQAIVQAIVSKVPVVCLPSCGIDELNGATVVRPEPNVYSNAVLDVLQGRDHLSGGEAQRVILQSWSQLEIEKTWEANLAEVEKLLKQRSKENLGY